MLKISIVDTSAQCLIVLEGKLIAPWVTELKKTWAALAADLGRRELVIDMANLTVVSTEGENALLELMRMGARFRCRGVFTKHIVQQLVLRHKLSTGDQFPDPCTDGEGEEGQG
jgi:anti-anti-sigma regulatory factor